MYSASYTSCDSDEGIRFPSFVFFVANGSYLACLYVRACLGNPSWQYVNSMNCIVCVDVGSKGVGA